MTLNDIISNLSRTGRSGDYRIEISTYCKNNITDRHKIIRKPECYIYFTQTGSKFELDIVSAKINQDALTIYQVNELLNSSCSLEIYTIDNKKEDMLSLYKTFSKERDDVFKEEQARLNRIKERMIDKLLHIQNSYNKIGTKKTHSVTEMVDFIIENDRMYAPSSDYLLEDLRSIEGRASLLELGLTE